MNDTKPSFDPIPVSNPAALGFPELPKPATSRTLPGAPASRPPFSAPDVLSSAEKLLPPGIAPETPLPENQAAPPPNTPEASNWLAGLFRPTRTKAAMLAGAVSLAGGMYGLNLIFPQPLPSLASSGQQPDPKESLVRKKLEATEPRTVESAPKLLPIPAFPETPVGTTSQPRTSGELLPVAAAENPFQELNGIKMPDLPHTQPAPGATLPTPTQTTPSLPVIPPTNSGPAAPVYIETSGSLPDPRLPGASDPLPLPSRPGITELQPVANTQPTNPLPVPTLPTTPATLPSNPQPLPVPTLPTTPNLSAPEVPLVTTPVQTPELKKPEVAPTGTPLPLPALQTGGTPEALPLAGGNEPKQPLVVPMLPSPGTIPATPVGLPTTPTSLPAAPPTLPENPQLAPSAPLVPMVNPGAPTMAPVGDNTLSAPVTANPVIPVNPALTPLAPPAKQPVRTDFDVDLHTVRSGDTYQSISKRYYDSPQYAADLQAFNDGSPIGIRPQIEIPPLHVIRKLRERTAAPQALPPTAPIEQVGRVQGAAERVDWNSAGSGTSGQRRETRWQRYVTPREGMTFRDVAFELYGTEREWGKIDNKENYRFRPDERLPRGTTLIVPIEEVEWR